MTAVDRFGAQAVFGRPMGASEIHALMMAETIRNATAEQQASEDWGAWESKHPTKAKLLKIAIQSARNMGLIDEYGEML